MMKAMCGKIRALRYVSLCNTLYWNFRLFPGKTAMRLPVYFGHRMQIERLRRGQFVLADPKPRRGGVTIGVTPFPIIPTRGVDTLIRLGEGSRLVVGRDVRIAAGCSLVASFGGEIRLGDDVFINQDTMLYSNAAITIADHVRIRWQSQLYDSAIHFMVDTETGKIRDPKKPIRISNNVWCANHVTLTAGAEIPPFTTVASHSLVNKSFIGKYIGGGILRGAPAQYYPGHRVRIWNEALEGRIKSDLVATGACEADIIDYGHSALPLDPDENPIYIS